MKLTIKKNDIVRVLAGKDRGKEGKVLRVFPVTGRVIVEGIGTVKRRLSPRRSGAKGTTIDKTMPIDASNVALMCGSCKRGVRTRTKIDGSEKSRVCVRCGHKI